MRSIYLLVLIAIGISTVYGSTGLSEFCSHSKKCYITSLVPTSVPTDVATTTQHEMIKFNFVYFANVSYDSAATDQVSDNSINLAIVINNVLKDPCGQNGCWMRIRPQTDYPFVDPGLDGYYDYTNNTLSLYPEFIFGFPEHASQTNFSVSFETCIVNTLFDYNHCSEDFFPPSNSNRIPKSKWFGKLHKKGC